MEKPSTARIALKWGIIISIVLCILVVVLYITDLYKSGAFSFVGYAFMLVGIILAGREFRTLNEGFMSFGEGLGLGTLISAVCGLIVSLFSYIYTTVIDTTIMQQIQEFQREQMETRGLTEEQIDQTMEAAAIFMQPGIVLVVGFFMYLLIGFILSLLMAAILKKEKPEMLF